MGHDEETKHGFADTASRFAEKLRHDNHLLLHETREVLRELCDRMNLLDAQMKNLHQQVDRLQSGSHEHAQFAKSLDDIHQWQRSVKGPIEAATRLEHAAHGARFIVIGIFGFAVCAMAVAGVLELMYRWFNQVVR